MSIRVVLEKIVIGLPHGISEQDFIFWRWIAYCVPQVSRAIVMLSYESDEAKNAYYRFSVTGNPVNSRAISRSLPGVMRLRLAVARQG